ncbi:hypothetical protein BH24CHL4_BH24CHL4_03790 [soil metagenome]
MKNAAPLVMLRNEASPAAATLRRLQFGHWPNRHQGHAKELSISCRSSVLGRQPRRVAIERSEERSFAAAQHDWGVVVLTCRNMLHYALNPPERLLSQQLLLGLTARSEPNHG